MVIGSAAFPASGGLTPGPQSDVSVECLPGDGSQFVYLLPSPQAESCQTTGGNGRCSGRRSAGATDDHAPGAAVDSECLSGHTIWSV